MPGFQFIIVQKFEQKSIGQYKGFHVWLVVDHDSPAEHKLYLDLVTYYGKFLPDMSTLLALLYHLLGPTNTGPPIVKS